MRHRLVRPAATRNALLTLAGASLVACSLVNALDDVRPQILPSTAGSDSGPGKVADAAGGTDANTGVVDAGPPKGAIVIGGAIGADAGAPHILTAIAPETGSELPLARENLTVSAIRYDGARDLWYIFETGGAGYFPLPSDQVSLQVRTLETHTGAWQKLNVLAVNPIVSFLFVAVLTNRLVYVAYRDVSDIDKVDLVVVDTTDPQSLQVLNTYQLDTKPIGMLGAPSDTQSGGTINVFTSLPCDADPDPDASASPTLCLSEQHFAIPSTGAPVASPKTSLGSYSGAPSFGTYRTQSIDLVGFKETTSASLVKFHEYNQTTNLPLLAGATIDFGMNEGFLKPMAVDECTGIGFVTATNTDLNLYAVPLVVGPKPGAAQLDHSGQGVYWEPYTKSVLAPFSQGSGFTLTAMTITAGLPGVAPQVVKRGPQSWTPPTDVAPEIVATRTPYSFVCPP